MRPSMAALPLKARQKIVLVLGKRPVRLQFLERLPTEFTDCHAGAKDVIHRILAGKRGHDRWRSRLSNSASKPPTVPALKSIAFSMKVLKCDGSSV